MIKKVINDFTYKFLTYSSATLFGLFILIGFEWYNSSILKLTDTVTTIVNLVGGICILAWFYAIIHKAQELLLESNIILKIFKNINCIIIIAIILELLIFIFSMEDFSTYENISGFITFQLMLHEPVEFTYILFFLIILLSFSSAKLLVSAENNNVAKFREYFVTFLLFIVPFIGVWFIQPRVKTVFSE